MDNISKKFGSLLIIALLTLLLTGCDSPPWESGMVLALKVETPKNGTTVTTPNVVVGGRVNGSQAAQAKVAINGTDVPVKDRKFSSNITLTEGTNVLNIAASSGGAALRENVTVTYAPSK
ncbi:MAG: hypothetical protein CVU64_11385 [Deltaproteobacteria bacterium HGW-Deltaproteobacteria-21]|jgi:uncharacterized lipoprotein YajG|nr:MAG: hypothetical protein CVU64_11385 [Deltaproteobacteria bacterium HGW-Deltaproteobacteria-21]